jgi:hypothetical protein
VKRRKHAFGQSPHLHKQVVVMALSNCEDGEIPVFARALDRAIKAAPASDHDPEETRAILITGIEDAIRRGVRDEDMLTDAALAALALYDDDAMDDVMKNTPL